MTILRRLVNELLLADTRTEGAMKNAPKIGLASPKST